MVLKDLAKWALENQATLMAAPAIEARICEQSKTKGGGSTDVVFRQDKFQIERIKFIYPSSVPLHRHPNMVTYEQYVSGCGEVMVRTHKLWLEGSQFKELTSRMKMLLPSTTFHGLGRTGPEGLILLSVQEWQIIPTSVIVDWEIPAQ